MAREGLLIGETAKRSGASRKALRLYEAEGILAEPRRTARGIECTAWCRHCGTPLEFSVAPTGPGPDAGGVMLWLGRPAADRSRIADSL